MRELIAVSVLAATTVSSDMSSTPLASRSFEGTVRRDPDAPHGLRALWSSAKQYFDPIVRGKRPVDQVREDERRLSQLCETSVLLDMRWLSTGNRGGPRNVALAHTCSAHLKVHSSAGGVPVD